jgi:SOS response regulatory protein OraA/RecX
MALAMLARRALSHAEIAERLARRGGGAPAVAAEIRRLDLAGLLDEAALARSVCRAQLRAGRGRRAVIAALKRRKVAKDAAEGALAELAAGEGEGAALAAAFAKVTAKHRFWRRLPGERRKVIRYLLARGFSLDLVNRALRENGRDEPHGDQTDDAGDPLDLP